MPISQETLVLDGGASEFRRRRRTSSRGTTDRYTIDIKAEPVLFDFSTERLGQGTALAIRDALSDKMKLIKAQVSPSTQRRRRVLERAYASGERYAVRRFSGGRTGATPPRIGSNQLFNHSQRLANGLAVRHSATGGEFNINVPANRFSTREFTEAELTVMFRRLRQQIPELATPSQLLRDPQVKRAIRDSILDMITTQKTRRKQLNKRALSALGLGRLAAFL